MDKDKLKKILSSISLASLLAGSTFVGTFTVGAEQKPAQTGCSG